MIFNYHEMTYNEPRDSPQRKLQFHVICTIIIVTTIYTLLSNDIFHPIIVSYGTFHGGTYIYKLTYRDYASSQSLVDHIVYTDLVCPSSLSSSSKTNEEKDTLDLSLSKEGKAAESVESLSLSSCYRPVYDDIYDEFYTIYMDNPSIISNGRDRRYTVGYLVRDHDDEKTNTKKTKKKTKDSVAIQEKLITINKSIIPPTLDEINTLPAMQLWTKLQYQQISIPDSDVMIIEYPYYYDSFVSLLIHMMKVFPALYNNNAASTKNKDNNNTPILSTCSIHKSICTYYIPIIVSKSSISESTESSLSTEDISSSSPFYLGRPDTVSYAKTLPIVHWYDPFVNLFGTSSTTSTTTTTIDSTTTSNKATTIQQQTEL